MRLKFAHLENRKEEMEQANYQALTNPSIPAGNFGRDNVFHDLIVKLYDVIEDPKGHRYQVVKPLGRGQFGQVFQVIEQTGTQQSYAMKITKSDMNYRQQALHEVQVLSAILENTSQVELGNISKLADWFIYYDHICIVIELLSFDLFEIIKRRDYRGLPLTLVQGAIKGVLEGLVVCERCGVIHSDIKPENILLVDGFTPAVKLIDFGSARFSNQQCYYYIQSRYYRAPEVVLGIPHSYAIDIWSVGCVAFEIFLGMPLFPGQSEIHLLELIVEMMGQFPDCMVQASPRRNELFHSNGKLKSEEQICREKGTSPVQFRKYFSYDTLEDNVLNYEVNIGNTPEKMRKERRRRLLFIDFLQLLLQLNPSSRPNAAAALQHPFITTDLTE